MTDVSPELSLPALSEPVKLYCGQHQSSWNLILRRQSADILFPENVIDYIENLGTNTTDYWIGLAVNIFTILSLLYKQLKKKTLAKFRINVSKSTLRSD